jgi:hypothetical protein
MKSISKQYAEKYQCPGCSNGVDTKCGFHSLALYRHDCQMHHPGTMEVGTGKLFLGLPSGFNRLGVYNEMKIEIYPENEDLADLFDKYNLPVWKTKYQDDTLVRGLRPRKNEPFLVVIQGQSKFDTINCVEITEDEWAVMD